MKLPKRPRDANQLAKMVVDLSTGQVEEETKAASQQKGGLAGGAKRAEVLTPEQRAEIASVAAQARWRKRT